MPSNLIKQIQNKISEDWAQSSLHFFVCNQIVEYISNNKHSDVQHLTIGSFRKLISRDIELHDVLDCLRYLTGSRIKLLRVGFEYIDDNEECYLLSKEEVKQAQTKGELVHPLTGELVPSPEEHIFLYYSPSQSISESSH